MHLTGYSRYQASPSAVVVDMEGYRTLLVPRHELAPAEESASVNRILAYGGGDLLDFTPLHTLAAACSQLVDGDDCLFAGNVAARDVFVHVSPCAWVDCDAELRALRKVKDPDELARIRRAFELALIGQEVAAEQAARGRAEIEIFSSAHAAAQEAAGAPVDFIATVAAGANSASICAPLHVPGSARVQEGDPLLCDIAVRHKGYWGDSTRTFRGDSEVQRTRSVLTEILETSSGQFGAGTAVADAYRRMADSISEALPEASFPHHGGHGIGITLGEDPQIIPDETSIAESGMVFALEPGAYFSGRYGVRVENTYVVDEDRARLITEVEP